MPNTACTRSRQGGAGNVRLKEGTAMDEFIKQLSSPSWWIGVVVIGIVINVISAPLGRVFEAQLGKVSSWQRHKSQEKIVKRQKLLESLRKSEIKQLFYAMQEQRLRIRSFENFVIGSLSLGVVFMALVLAGETIRETPILLIFVVIFGLFSLLAFYATVDDSRSAIEIKHNLKEINPDIYID